MTNNKIILNEFEELFESMGIVVKYDNLINDGGYCKYKDKEYIILNRILPLKRKLEIYKNILKEMMLTKGEIFIKPILREYIENDKND